MLKHLLPAGQSLLSDCSILVVDRCPASRDFIASILHDARFPRVSFAPNGETALRLLREERPDLLLIDFRTPGKAEAELCAAARSDAAMVDLPIIAMLPQGSAGEWFQAMSLGASDMITTPLSAPELIARTRFHLERRLLVRKLRDYHERTAAELNSARTMQQGLLPSAAAIREMAERHDLAMAAVFRPSAELGGDLWGAWSIDATRVGVFVCDVTGHDTVAAINTFRLHTLLTRNDLDRSDPGRLLSTLNDRLTGLLSPGHFVTMLYLVLDTRHDRITYAAAGSPEPLLAIPGTAIQALDGSGLPLGIVPGIGYPNREAPFGRGARLLLYSDALPDARQADATHLGEERARAIAEAALDCADPDRVIQCLDQRIGEDFAGSLGDDLTLICVGRPERPERATPEGGAAGQAADGRRLLVASGSFGLRLAVQCAVAPLGVEADGAPDLTCASRFVCGFRYDMYAVDLGLGMEEVLELLRLVATAQPGARLILLGPKSPPVEGLAASLGLDVCAALPVPAETGALQAVLARTLEESGQAVRRVPHQAGGRTNLKSALARGEITFSFQPQISLATGRPIGAEALARWTSREQGAVPLGALLALAEDDEAALHLADLTLRTALLACSSWRRVSPGMSVAVNLSASALQDAALPALIRARLTDAALAPEALAVEVGCQEAARCDASLVALRQIGVGVVLDDFGEHAVDFRALQRSPANAVKFGRAIVQRCGSDEDATRLVQAMASAARCLDVTVAAVGVETHAAEQMLREAGCSAVQGWLYGPAMPAAAIERMLMSEQGTDPGRARHSPSR